MPRQRHVSLRLTVVLIAICAVLGAVLSWQWRSWQTIEEEERWTVERREIPPEAEPSGSARPETAIGMPDLDTYAEITARPLFSQSRRPPAPDVAPSDAGEEEIVVEKPEFILRGVVLSDEQRVAIVQTQGASRLAHVIEGEELEGWRVETVDAEKVVMRRGDASAEFLLEDTFRLKQQAAPRGRRVRQRQSTSARGRPPPAAAQMDDEAADDAATD